MLHALVFPEVGLHGVSPRSIGGASEQLLPPREVFHIVADRLADRRLWAREFRANRSRRGRCADFFNFHGMGCGHR